MPQNNRLRSLELIVDDIYREISSSVKLLDLFLADTSTNENLSLASSHLNKLKGIFTLLEMRAAKQLTVESILLVEVISKSKQKKPQKLLELISTSLLEMHRYLEHLGRKDHDIPELLIPTINRLRSLTQRKQLTESAFFMVNVDLKRKNKEVFLLTSELSASRSRHFRQMYQIGLIEVIRQTNIRGGFRMMRNALQKLDEKCARPSSPNLWWIANALITSFACEDLNLSKSRFKLFSLIDRQIRNIENKNESLYDNNKIEMEWLAKEMLFLVWISAKTSTSRERLCQHFKLEPAHITDSKLREEFIDLKGPSDQDFGSIAEALAQELISIDSKLASAHDESYEPSDLAPALAQMISLNNMLKIIQIDDQIVRLAMAVDLIEKSIEADEKLPTKDIKILRVVIDNISKSINKSELSNSSQNKSSRRRQLSAQQNNVRGITHARVKQLMEMLTQFISNNKKVLLLKNGPKLFEQIQQGFKELDQQRAVKLVDKIHSFFTHHLQQAPKATTEEQINLFADSISGMEFYLETLEYTATPSERILEFAENSIATLS
ncbi:MAG: hypothetical protein KUG78_10175 [Kangiellaceae bacterium]|nr:hypothetical protein [Kangiellaceae bacterium]